MKRFLKHILPRPVQKQILRGLRFFPDRHALSLPDPPDLVPPDKAALVSYVTAPFKEGSGSTLFTHAGVPKLMAQAVQELGYSVDVIEWDNTAFKPRKDYQLFIGHAGMNFERLAARLSPQCVNIYFSTGTYWQEHNRAEKARFDALEQRRGIRLPPDRPIENSEEGANALADGIICLGNHLAKKSYAKFPAVYHLNNAAYPLPSGPASQDDTARAASTGFLFLSSEGNVHKGLDLLLETFSRPDVQAVAQLYICQKIRPDFHALYKRELEDTPNIHLVGHVDLQSGLFQETRQKCTFLIHPSCAEGQPGAVLDGMRYGLIPVLTPENHVDVDDCGFMISASLPELAEEVKRLSRLPIAECRRLAQNAQEAVARDFSPEGFSQNIKRSISSIVSCKAGYDVPAQK